MNYLRVLFLMLSVSSGFIESAGYAQRAAKFFGNGIYWGATFATPIFAALSLYKKNKLELEAIKTGRFIDLSYPKTPGQKLIKEELIKLGLPKTGIVMSLEGHYSGGALTNHIRLSSGMLLELDECLYSARTAQQFGEKPSQYIADAIRHFKGVLHHEAHHVLHNDLSRLFAVSLASAFVPVGIGFASRALRPVVFGAQKLSNVHRALSGVANLCISAQLFLAGSRVIEQQADDAITDRDAMRGMLLHLQSADNRIKHEFENDPIGLWAYNNVCTHPSPASRAERLEKRMQEKD